MNKVNFKSIILFYVIAVLCSYFFRINVPEFIAEFNPENELILVKYLLEGIGPFLGGFITFYVFKNKSDISLFGSSPVRSIIMIFSMLIVYSIIGINNKMGLNKHYYGFLIGSITLVYCLLEEYGWRKFLNYELREIDLFWRSVIIGTMWFAWHLNFASDIGDLFSFWLILVFGSWGIAKICENTKSLFAVACFHSIGSLTGLNKLISFTAIQQYIALAVFLAMWIYIVSRWNKPLILKESK